MSRIYKIVPLHRESMNQLLKWHSTKLFLTNSCFTGCLYIVWVDTKKDPHLMAEALITPRVNVDCCLRDHFSAVTGFWLLLYTDI